MFCELLFADAFTFGATRFAEALFAVVFFEDAFVDFVDFVAVAFFALFAAVFLTAYLDEVDFAPAFICFVPFDDLVLPAVFVFAVGDFFFFVMVISLSLISIVFPRPYSMRNILRNRRTDPYIIP